MTEGSLENIYVRLRSIPRQLPLWKLIIICGLFPAIISVGVISFLLNTNSISPLQVPIIELALLTIFTIAYSALAMISILFGIFLVFLLIKIRNQFYKSNGVVIGNSLSTNHDFLRKLAKGLFPHLIGLLKSYNDPRFDAQDTRLTKLENRESPPNAVDYNRIILEQRRTILDLKKINKNQNELIKQLQSNQAEKEHEIEEKAQAYNNNENIKSIDDSNKIEFLDE